MKPSVETSASHSRDSLRLQPRERDLYRFMGEGVLLWPALWFGTHALVHEPFASGIAAFVFTLVMWRLGAGRTHDYPLRTGILTALFGGVAVGLVSFALERVWPGV